MQLIRQDLERERKSKQGLENLSRAIKQTPNFGTDDSQQNVSEKMYHVSIIKPLPNRLRSPSRDLVSNC